MAKQHERESMHLPTKWIRYSRIEYCGSESIHCIEFVIGSQPFAYNHKFMIINNNYKNWELSIKNCIDSRINEMEYCTSECHKII